MEFHFNQIFRELPDGSLTPVRRIRVGGIELGPGVTFQKGASFAGVDFTLFRGYRIEADDESGVLIIQRMYP